MDTVLYENLENKEELFILWMKSFGWPGTPEWLERFKYYETRIGKGPVGMCGLMDGKLVGFVGIMIIPTRNKYGEVEKVGGIYAIATRPDYSRRGIGRRLLEASENYLREQGAKLAFLTTSRSIVAYKWYCDAGYNVVEIVDNYPYMYNIFNPPRQVDKDRKQDEKFKLDFDQVQTTFDWFVRNLCGFVIRDKKYLKAAEMIGVFTPKLSYSTDRGHAFLRSSCDTIQFQEILARDEQSYRELIEMGESKAKYAAAAIHPFDRTASSIFENMGYVTDKGNFGVLMYKSLDGAEFSALYDERFMISRLDWF
ncbi:MAG: GNAT family N-acetyltransferase [candidate division Zixibacteria bacterium]|nr:GNAT family N-acetyltransferase [candidate division Zixibacteria bacterium]